MTQCIFCDIYETGVGIIYENDKFFSIFDKFPVAPGNALIISKRHVANLSELTQEEWAVLKEAIDSTIKVIESSDLKSLYSGFVNNPLNEKSKSFSQIMLTHIGISKKPEGYNFGVNEGEAAGRTIAHFHVNIIPRYFGDMKDSQRGIKKIFPEFERYT